MSRFFERLEGAFLIVLGILTLMPAAGGSYLSFMNPRYRWMMLISGVVLSVIGLMVMLRPRHEHRRSRILALIPFLAIFGFALR